MSGHFHPHLRSSWPAACPILLCLSVTPFVSPLPPFLSCTSLYFLQPSGKTSWPPGTRLNSPCFSFYVHLVLFCSSNKCGCHIIICEEHKAPNWGFKKTCVASNKPPFINNKLHDNAVKKNAVPLAATYSYVLWKIYFYGSISSRHRSGFLKCGRVSATPFLTAERAVSRRGLCHEAHEKWNFPVCMQHLRAKKSILMIMTKFTTAASYSSNEHHSAERRRWKNNNVGALNCVCW